MHCRVRPAAEGSVRVMRQLGRKGCRGAQYIAVRLYSVRCFFGGYALFKLEQGSQYGHVDGGRISSKRRKLCA